MSDLNKTLHRNLANEHGELEKPIWNLRRSFYGKWNCFLPDELTSGTGRVTRYRGSLCECSRFARFGAFLKSSLHKVFWENVRDVPGQTPQGL